MNIARGITPLCALLAAYLSLGSANSYSQTTIETSLLNDIKKATQALSATQHSQMNARQQYSKEISALEQEVIQLRDKSALFQRESDEKTLSLQQLEKRLEKWQQQNNYQQNLIQQFARQFNLTDDASSATEQPTRHTLKHIIGLGQSLNNQLNPHWRSTPVVTRDGKINQMQILQIGPLIWYWSAINNVGGLAQKQKDFIRVGQPFNTTDNQNLSQFVNQGKGSITFDPSLERVAALEKMKESPWQHIVKGGMWVVPILLFGCFAFAVALIKAVQLLRLQAVKTLSDSQIIRALNGEKTIHAPLASMQESLLQNARDKANSTQIDDQLFNTLCDQQEQLNRWLGAIAITATVSPLLGLLGTVSGMITTFKMMTVFGSADPEIVSGGIAQALITTELGLIVAIPALVIHALLSKKAKNDYQRLENFAVQISQVALQISQVTGSVTQTKPADSQQPSNKTAAHQAASEKEASIC